MGFLLFSCHLPSSDHEIGFHTWINLLLISNSRNIFHSSRIHNVWMWTLVFSFANRYCYLIKDEFQGPETPDRVGCYTALLMLEGWAFGNSTSFTLHPGISQGFRVGEMDAILLLTDAALLFKNSQYPYKETELPLLSCWCLTLTGLLCLEHSTEM